MAEKLTAGQRLYKDLFPIDPLTGKPTVALEKKLSNRVGPSVLPLPPVPFAPELKLTLPPTPIGKDAQGRPFVIKDTSSLPARVKKIRVTIPDLEQLVIEPPKAPRGSLIPRELTPLSLQPIIEPRTKDIALPALEDFYQLVPNDLMTAEQRRQKAIDRAIRIRDTAAPPWKRVAGQIHAWLDNIEDAIITGVVLLRPLARRFPRLLGPLSYAVTAAEILNVAASVAAFPSSKSARLLWIKRALGRNPFLIQSRLKGKALLRFQTLSTAQKLRIANLPNLERITRLSPTLGESLEMAQTMHDVFGVGLLLGPLYGTLDEIAFSMLKREKVNLRLAPQGPAFSAALQNLQRAIPLLQPGAPILDKDYLLTLGSISINTNLLLQDLQGAALSKVLENEPKKRRRPPKGTSPETIAAWEQLGEPIVEDDFVWPGIFEREPDPDVLGEQLAEGAIQESRRRIIESTDPTFKDLATDLITDIAGDTLKVWEGPDVETAQDLDSMPGAIITLAEAGLVIDPACDPDAISRTLEKVAQVEAFTVRSALPASAIEDIARREGCRLLPIAHET